VSQAAFDRHPVGHQLAGSESIEFLPSGGGSKRKTHELAVGCLDLERMDKPDICWRRMGTHSLALGAVAAPREVLTPSGVATPCHHLPQASGMDKCAKDARTPRRLNAEEPGSLRQREPESRHFAEFRLDPRAQIMFLWVCSARDVRAVFSGLQHG
jgi:hypothetical protein